MKRVALSVVIWLALAPVALAQEGEAGSAEAPDAETSEGEASAEVTEAEATDAAGPDDAGADEQTPLPSAEDRHPLGDAGAQERARLHFQSGASYYEAGSYEDALREWTRAYELSDRPELLYNLSLAHQGLNHLEEARDHLRRFLDEVEDIPNRANLETRVQNLNRRIAEQAATPESISDHDPDPPPPPRARESSTYISPGAIGGFVGAGVGVGMFVIFGGLALAEDSALQEGCPPDDLCGEGAADGLRTFALVADIGLGIAVAGGALGLVFLLVDTGPSKSEVAVLPWLDPSGGGIAAGGSF